MRTVIIEGVRVRLQRRWRAVMGARRGALLRRLGILVSFIEKEPTCAAVVGRHRQALALISKLFKIYGECAELPPGRRGVERARRARVVLERFDAWIEANRDDVDPRGPLDQAIGYYDNQRAALHRFVEDERLQMHNNFSEQALRNLVLGRANWMFFENETGLKWYTVFRSLIASCTLHGLNPQAYLQAVLRLTPHWPVNRVIELAPKYWPETNERLDDGQRAIIEAPWQREWPRIAERRGPAAAA